MSIASMILIPIFGFARLALDQQVEVRGRNLDSAGQGLVRSYFFRDVASADTAIVSGSQFADCSGGDGASGTVLLVLVEDSTQTVYSRGSGSGSGASLWRRTCDLGGGSTIDANEVVTGLSSSGAEMVCMATGATAGTCQRLNLRMTSVSGRQSSLTVSVRDDGAVTVDAPGGPSYPSPAVALTASEVSVYRGDVISFSGLGSSDPDGGSLTYYWEFGDGGSSWDRDHNYSFSHIGSYTAILTVTNAAGTPATDFVVIEVKNRPPVASIETPANGAVRLVGDTVTFSSTGSGDSGDEPFGGHIVSYLWDFGDGTTSSLPNPTHVYSSASGPSGYTVRLTVTDDVGTPKGQAQISLRIQSPPNPLIASPASGAVVARGQEVNFSSAGSGDADGNIVAYLWSFGDGSTSTAANPSHTYASSVPLGPLSVTLQVTDNDGIQRSASITLSLRSRGPEVSLTRSVASQYAPTNRSSAPTNPLTITPSVVDPDGDAIASYTWNFGNGVSASGTGTPTAVNPSLTYPTGTGDTFISTSYVVTLTVWDANGDQGAASTTVTIKGIDAPTGLAKVSSRCSVWFFGCWERALKVKWDPTANASEIQVMVGSTVASAAGSATTTEVTDLSGNAQNYGVRIRARSSLTGLWGPWSDPAVTMYVGNS